MHETLEKMKRDNVNTFCTKEEMERRWKEETTKMTNLNAKNDNGGGWRSRSGESTTSYDDRWTKAELARLTKDTRVEESRERGEAVGSGDAEDDRRVVQK